MDFAGAKAQVNFIGSSANGRSAVFFVLFKAKLSVGSWLEFIKRDADETNGAGQPDKKLANDNTKLALIEHKLDTIAWVSKTTLGAVLVALVGAVLSLILK